MGTDANPTNNLLYSASNLNAVLSGYQQSLTINNPSNGFPLVTSDKLFVKGLVANSPVTLSVATHDGSGSYSNIAIGCDLSNYNTIAQTQTQIKHSITNISNTGNAVPFLTWINNVGYISQIFATTNSPISVSQYYNLYDNNNYNGQVQVGWNGNNVSIQNGTVATSLTMGPGAALNKANWVCGAVDGSSGAILSNQGCVSYTVSKQSTGVYNINLAQAHPAGSAYCAFVSSFAFSSQVNGGNQTSTMFQVQLFTQAGSSVDKRFSFIVPA